MNNRDQQHLFQNLTFSSCIQISSKIGFSLVLPFCILTLAHWYISDVFLAKIIKHQRELYHNGSDTTKYHHLKHTLNREWTVYSAVGIAYFFVGVLGFYLLSIATTTYAVACIYLSKETHIKKLIRAIPQLWKRLIITFLGNFFIQFVYNVVAAGLIASSLALAASSPHLRDLGITIAIILVVLYILGVIYINAVWQLAGVISVLEEDTYGLKAMRKSQDLLKGKSILFCALYAVFVVLLIWVRLVYSWIVFHGLLSSIVLRVVVGIGWFLILTDLIELGLVVQSVVYFVCKSHHNESIDRACLDDRLESYAGKYGRLSSGGDV